MIFVILGHSLDLGGVNDRLANSLQYWIYTFHMPLLCLLRVILQIVNRKTSKRDIELVGRICYISSTSHSRGQKNA